MKRKLISILLVLVFVLQLAVSIPAMAAGDATDTGLDVVIVVDRSGSMEDSTDRNHIAPLMAQVFVKLSADSDRVAYIGFHHDITCQTGFVDMNDADASNRLCEQIKADKVKGGDTNTGLALQEAYKLIDSEKQIHPNHTYTILLISDGEVNMDSHPAKGKTTKQTVQDSIQLGTEVVTNHRDDVALYCVGVNEKTTNLGSDMERWAKLTADIGGRYAVVQTFDGPGGAFEKMLDFYQLMKKQELVEFNKKTGEFSIDVVVATANIVITPMTDPDLITVINPDGNKLDLSDSGKVEIQQVANDKGKQYCTILQLKQPEIGTWKLELPEGSEYEVKISTIPDVVLKLEDLSNVYQKGDVIHFKMTGVKSGSTYFDPADSAKLRIIFPDGTDKDFNMTPDPANNCHVSDLTLADTLPLGEYKVIGFLSPKSNSNFASSTNQKTPYSFELATGGIRAASGINIDHTFDGHILAKYDPFDAGDVTAFFSNPDALPIVKYGCSASPEGFVNVEIDANNHLIYTAQNATVSPHVDVEVWAEWEGQSAVIGLNNESQHVKGTVIVKDAQDSIQLIATPPNGEPFEIEQNLPAKDEDAIALLADKDARTFFLEPNVVDGETFDITYEVQDPSLLKILPGDDLKVVGLEKGETKIDVVATSSDGSTASFTVSVIIKNLSEKILKIGLIALGTLIAIIIFIALIIKANKPKYENRSSLAITVEVDGDQENGSLSLARYGKKTIKVYDLLNYAHISAHRQAAAIKTWTVSPRKGGGIVINYVADDSGRKKKGVATLHDGESRTIDLNQENGDSISFDYSVG